VRRVGIEGLSRDEIIGGRDRCWRLLATAVRGGATHVQPVALRRDHPFAQLTGPQNAVTVTAVVDDGCRRQIAHPERHLTHCWGGARRRRVP
jgi:homoserine dehydrogenase